MPPSKVAQRRNESGYGNGSVSPAAPGLPTDGRSRLQPRCFTRFPRPFHRLMVCRAHQGPSMLHHCCAARGQHRKEFHQCLTVAHACSIGAASSLLTREMPLRRTCELAIVTDADHVAVRRTERLEWHDVGVRIAIAFGHLARNQVILCLVHSMAICNQAAPYRCTRLPVRVAPHSAADRALAYMPVMRSEPARPPSGPPPGTWSGHRSGSSARPVPDCSHSPRPTSWGRSDQSR